QSFLRQQVCAFVRGQRMLIRLGVKAPEAVSPCCGQPVLKQPRMPVNSTHPEYDNNLPSWERIRDVLLGDAAVKRAGEKYVARLDSQSESEFQAYVDSPGDSAVSAHGGDRAVGADE